MTKRSTKKSKQPTTLAVIVTLIIAVIVALQSAQKTSAPAPTSVVMTQLLPITATAAPNTPMPTGGISTPLSATRPAPTDLPGLEITPINAALYEVTGSVGGLGCPDSRCKEISTYKKGSIIVVTGSVAGTTYKTKKTRLWYQVIFHDGSRIYVHASYVKPHEVGATN